MARGQSERCGDRQPVGQGVIGRLSGFDAGKKVIGREWHIAVDAGSRLL